MKWVEQVNNLFNTVELQETANRFNENRDTFICTEAIRIFCETDNMAIKLDALKLLAAQP